MEKSVLFFDIDGTILSEITRTVPDSAVSAIREAQKNGHILFINTGRTISSIPSEVSRIGFDGYLCGCGTYLVYDGELMFSRSIPEQRGRDIIRKMAECDLYGVAEGVEDVYFPERITRFDNLEQSRRYFREKGWESNSLWSAGTLRMTSFLCTAMNGVIWMLFLSSSKRIWRP